MTLASKIGVRFGHSPAAVETGWRHGAGAAAKRQKIALMCIMSAADMLRRPGDTEPAHAELQTVRRC